MRRAMSRMVMVCVCGLLCVSLGCEDSSTDANSSSTSNASPSGKGDQATCPPADQVKTIAINNNGSMQTRCQGPDGRFVATSCCEQAAATPTGEELECLCFEHSYNRCLVEAGVDGDIESCIKIPDDTLLDEECCMTFGAERFPVMCADPFDVEGGDATLASFAEPLCAEPEPSNNTPVVMPPTEAEELAACICLEHDYNSCLLRVGEDDIEPCTKPIDDNLEDENCCERFGDQLSILCIEPFDAIGGDQDLADRNGPSCSN